MITSEERGHRYRCPCTHELQVFGRGRHRVYFARADTALADPVMSGACPECRAPLPGKHLAATDGVV